MATEKEKPAVPVPPAPTDGEQPLSKSSEQSIAEENSENNPPEKNFEEMLRMMQRMNTLSDRLEDVLCENRTLRNVAVNYERVSRAYGPERVAATVEAVKLQEQAEKEQKRVVRQRYDRGSR